MLNFFAWYLLVTLLGWLTFPLAWRLFPALADRGYSLARAFGLLIWGYVFWMMGSLGIAQNDGAGLLLALVILMVLSGSGLLRAEKRTSLGTWLKSNLRMIISVEVLFFLAFAFLAFIRAGNPEIIGTEKPMELAFINAVIRSPTFPPHDPWLSGYAISYYYFGYVMTAMLAKATGTLGSVAFNLMLALVFALSAVGAYGVIYNLLARTAANRKPFLGLPLLGPLFLLIVSNFEGFFEILYRRGLFWKFNPDGTASSSFWNWLNLQNLRDAPTRITPGFMPERYYWWWRASRVITETNLTDRPNEIIDEFPFFSYLLGDLHPHVLAMPFGLLAVAVALNLFLGGWKGETNLGIYRLPLRPAGLIFGALLLGGLAFLNTWDILTGFALLAGAFVLNRALAFGWTWKRLEDLFAFGIPLGLLAILLYLPFYAGFSSQAGGIVPNLEFSTSGAQLWIMFGPLLLPVFAYLIYLWRVEKRPAKWKAGLGLMLGLAILLWVFSWLLALLAQLKMPDFVSGYLADQGFASAASYFSAATSKRLMNIGSLLTTLSVIGAALAFLTKTEGVRQAEDENSVNAENQFSLQPSSFALLMILIASLLVLAPEFAYLRDQFGDRMNTIFKFYYQAWLLWSLAAAFGVAVILERSKAWKAIILVLPLVIAISFMTITGGDFLNNLLVKILGWILVGWLVVFIGVEFVINRHDAGGLFFHIGISILFVMALIYPVLGLLTKTDNFRIPAFIQSFTEARIAGDPLAFETASRVWILDGGTFFDRIYPEDMAAAAWLRSAPQGVIAEATKPDASYSDYSHISIYSGLPTVLGWPMHEGQWRGTYEPQGSRQEDIRRLYEAHNWDEALTVIQQYNIRYIYVGTLERQTYRVNETKFQNNLIEVYRSESGNVVIYEIPWDEVP